jgi:hypothetical protein
MVFGRESNGPASPVGKNSNWRWLLNLRILDEFESSACVGRMRGQLSKIWQCFHPATASNPD